jgi:hypothetical protein
MQDAQRARSTEPSARAMLTALAEAHAELRRELTNMEQLQTGPAPTAERWAYVRWKLSRASRQRRTAVDQAYPLALARATAAERVRIAQLQAQDPLMLATSREHIGHWTPERIAADWLGYCAASRLLRRSMADRVQAEQDILIPILTRFG